MMKLKNRLLALLIFLFVMAGLPLSVVRCDLGAPSAITPDSVEKTAAADTALPSAGNQGGENEEAVVYAASLCREDFCEEALKAAIILANTNRDSWGKEIFDSSEELKDRIRTHYSSEKELLYHHESKYIPIAPLSNGQTQTNDTYPYLTAVASPWDCLDENYNENNQCVGVSMNGVNYLCTKGCSAEEALLHYLPDFTVSS